MSEHFGSELEDVRSFLMGQMAPKEFETILRSNERLESLLKAEAPIPPYSTSSAHNLYQYLIELNYSRLQHVLNAQDVLIIFMQRRGAAFTGNTELRSWMNCLKQVLPKWLIINGDYLDLLCLDSESLIDKPLKDWLKRELSVRFKFVSKPPRWLQSPAWPIDQSIPLVFVGQISAGRYFHDETEIYVFLNPVSGKISTITQIA